MYVYMTMRAWLITAIITVHIVLQFPLLVPLPEHVSAEDSAGNDGSRLTVRTLQGFKNQNTNPRLLSYPSFWRDTRRF